MVGFWLAASLCLAVFFGGPVFSEEALRLDAGRLRIGVDGTGRLTSLEDAAAGVDYLHPKRASFLLQLKRYSEKKLKAPRKMKVLSQSDRGADVELLYDDQTSARVKIRANDGWLHFEIVGIEGVADVDRVRWGPYYTNIVGAVGEFLGLLHSDQSTVGLLSLEPNTDYPMTYGTYLRPGGTACAFWLAWPDKGSFVMLDALDHTRRRPIDFMRFSDAVEGFTVVGSKVALFCAPRDQALDWIGRIEVKENLPHPMTDGQWVKTNKAIGAPSIWTAYTDRDVDDALKLCQELNGGEICAAWRIFGNWGHFDLDPHCYRGGWPEARAISERCWKHHVRTTMYTLTFFTKPKAGVPEPFITPHVDPRFAHYDIASSLSAPLDKKGATVRVKASPVLQKLLERGANSKSVRALLWIGDELVFFGGKEVGKEEVVFTDCKRGFLMSVVQSHAVGDEVKFAYFAGYDNLYPGAHDMAHEIATIIGQRLRQGEFHKLTLDGHESALETGLGYFEMNDVLKTAYDLNRDRDVLYTGSCINNYAWHICSYISWGEFDLIKGFRGSMLDYRIRRQIQLARSLTPRKMGQHYPNDATLEDINWLMGVAAGWDSGVELCVSPKKFWKNPQFPEIKAAIQTWEKARRSGKLTARQKMALRQIDCVYRIAPKGDGTWKIELIRRWRDPRVEILDPSVVRLENLSGTEPARPTAIDISWTHSPLVYRRAAISNDMPVRADRENRWRVTFPAKNGGDINGDQLKIVLRAPEDSPTGIRNPLLSINGGQHCLFPVDLHPGEYLATPVNAPIAFVYNGRHEVIREVWVRYRNDLPNVGGRTTFTVELRFDSLDRAKTPVAFLNVLHSEIIRNEK